MTPAAYLAAMRSPSFTRSLVFAASLSFRAPRFLKPTPLNSHFRFLSLSSAFMALQKPDVKYTQVTTSSPSFSFLNSLTFVNSASWIRVFVTALYRQRICRLGE